MVQPEAAGPTEPRAGIIRAWVQKDPWVALTGGLGLVLYGVLRLAYSMFYAKLGLRPEDVGFGYAEILSQSVASLIVMLLMFLALLLSQVFFYGFLFTGLIDVGEKAAEKERSEPAPTQIPVKGWRRAVLVLFFVGFIGLFVWLLMTEPDAARDWVGRFFAFVAFPFFVVRGVIYSARRGWREFGGRYRRVTLGSLLLSVLLVLSVYFLAAPLDGAAVRRGQPVSSSFGPFPVASWGASYATVAWTGDPPAGFPKRCLMYLGQGNDKAVFFDVVGQRSIRVPLSGLTVFVDAEKRRDPSCSPDG